MSETFSPLNLPYAELGLKLKSRLPLSHSAMIPWTAEFTAQEASKAGGKVWTTEEILLASRENARAVYGV